MKVELNDFKRHATKILAELSESKDAVLVTKQGQPSAYLVHAQTFEIMLGKLALLEGLSLGERAILDGKTSSDAQARQRMQRWLK